MLQKMMEEQEGAFWRGLDLETGEELELGVPLPVVQLEEVGWWVWWGPAAEPAAEGPPLSHLGPGLMEVDGTKQAQEDGAMVENDAIAEQVDSFLS